MAGRFFPCNEMPANNAWPSPSCPQLEWPDGNPQNLPTPAISLGSEWNNQQAMIMSWINKINCPEPKRAGNSDSGPAKTPGEPGDPPPEGEWHITAGGGPAREVESTDTCSWQVAGDAGLAVAIATAGDTHTVTHTLNLGASYGMGNWKATGDDAQTTTVNHNTTLDFEGDDGIVTDIEADKVNIAVDMSGSTTTYAAGTMTLISHDFPSGELRLFIDPTTISGHTAGNQQVLTHAASGDFAWVDTTTGCT